MTNMNLTEDEMIGIQAELRSMRYMPPALLEQVLKVKFRGIGNIYEQDVAILFFLIEKYGSGKVRESVMNYLGTLEVQKENNESNSC